MRVEQTAQAKPLEMTHPEKRCFDRLKSLWPVSKALDLLDNMGLEISDPFLAVIAQQPPLLQEDKTELQQAGKDLDIHGRRTTPDYLYLKIRALLGDKTEIPKGKNRRKNRERFVLKTAAFIAQAAGVHYLNEFSAMTLGMNIYEIAEHINNYDLLNLPQLGNIKGLLEKMEAGSFNELFPTPKEMESSRLTKKDLENMASSVATLRENVALLKERQTPETEASQTSMASLPEIKLNNLSNVYKYLSSICLTEEEHLLPKGLKSLLYSVIENRLQTEADTTEKIDSTTFANVLQTLISILNSPADAGTAKTAAIVLLVSLTAAVLAGSAVAQDNEIKPTLVWQPSTARLAKPGETIHIVDGVVRRNPFLPPLNPSYPDSDIPFPPGDEGQGSLTGIIWPADTTRLFIAPGIYGFGGTWGAIIPFSNVIDDFPNVITGPTEIALPRMAEPTALTLLTSGPPLKGFIETQINGADTYTFMVNMNSLTNIQVEPYAPGTTLVVVNPNIITPPAHVTAHFIRPSGEETTSITTWIPSQRGIFLSPEVVDGAPPDFGNVVFTADDGRPENPVKVYTEALMMGSDGAFVIVNGAAASMQGNRITIDTQYPMGPQTTGEDRTFTLGPDLHQARLNWVTPSLTGWLRSAFPEDARLNPDGISTIFIGDEIAPGAQATVFNTWLDTNLPIRHVAFNNVSGIPGISVQVPYSPNIVFKGVTLSEDVILIFSGGIEGLSPVQVAAVAGHEDSHLSNYCLDHPANTGGNPTNELCANSVQQAILSAMNLPMRPYRQYLAICDVLGLPVFPDGDNPFCIPEATYYSTLSLLDPRYLYKALFPQAQLPLIAR